MLPASKLGKHGKWMGFSAGNIQYLELSAAPWHASLPHAPFPTGVYGSVATVLITAAALDNSRKKNVFDVFIVFKINPVLHVVLHPVEDLGSLFEKRDFKDRPQKTGTKSTLSLRLEQCPQQLNNPFNEYSKFDGKVNYSCSFIFK